MRNIWYKKTLVIGIIVLFLGVGIYPAVAVNPIKTTNILQEEEDNNQEEVKPISFCILRVWAWGRIEFNGPIPVLTWLKCEDLDTGKTRYGITVLLGNYFFGLQRGHTYKITALEFGASEVIELSHFWNYVDLFVGILWY